MVSLFQKVEPSNDCAFQRWRTKRRKRQERPAPITGQQIIMVIKFKPFIGQEALPDGMVNERKRGQPAFFFAITTEKGVEPGAVGEHQRVSDGGRHGYGRRGFSEGRKPKVMVSKRFRMITSS